MTDTITTPGAGAATTPTPAPAAAAPPAPAPAAPTAQTPPPGDGAKATTPTAFKLNVPEGMSLSDAGLAQIQKLAESKGWSQEDAQAYVEQIASEANSSVQASLERFNAQRMEWRESLQSDPEIGQGNWEKSLRLCKAVTDKLDPGDKLGLRQLMDSTGLGDNPAIVRAWVQLGKWLIPEEGAVVSGTPPAPAKSVGQKFFPNSNMNP